MMDYKANILIVEDEKDVSEIIAESLKTMGYRIVDIVSHGEKAIERALQLHPDLILMDITLEGEMDGVEAASSIQKQLDIPLIFITAYSDERTLQRAKITDPFGYLVKPFKIRELYINVEMALFKYQMERKVKESERWLKTTLTSMGEGVVATDPVYNIKFVNPVAESLTGWKKFEAIGKPLQNIFVIEDESKRHLSPEQLSKMFKKVKKIRPNSSYLITRTGKRIPIEFSFSSLDNNGEVNGFVLVFQNISERKKAEEALKRAHDELEQRVIKRTHELAEINKELRNEIRVRKETENKLKASLEEKDLLIKEIHHRVKNNMQVISSLLSLQSSYLEDPKAIEMLEDSQNRVRTMALIHEKLYRSKDLTQIDFNDFIENFSTQLHATFREYAPNVVITYDVDDISFGIDTAIPCGLIINELLTNSLKHAFPNQRKGKILISLKRNQDDHFTLSIRDNGIGFPAKIDINNPQTFGLQLLITLVEQLEGKLEISSKGGTTFKIRFSRLKYKRKI